MGRPYKGWSVFWRPEKKCWVLTRDGKQKLLPRTIKNKREAVKFATTWLEEQGFLEVDGTAKRTEETDLFGDMAFKWVKWRESMIGNGWESSTVSNNRSHVRHALKPLHGRTVAEITPKVLSELITSLTGAANTKRNIYRTLIALFDDCISQGWCKLEFNPAKSMLVEKVVPEAMSKAQEVQAETRFTLEQCQQLVSDRRIPVDRRVKYLCAVTMVARDGEVMGLSWGAIDFEAGQVRFIQAAKIRRYSTDPSIGKPKTTKSRRTIPLHSETARALTDWLHIRSRTLGKVPPPEHPVFPGRNPEQFTRTSAAKLLRKDLRTTGLKDSVSGVPFEFHHLRHTALNLLREAGVEPGARDALAGHAPKGAGEAHYQHRQLRDDVEKIALTWAGVQGSSCADSGAEVTETAARVANDVA